MASRGGEKIEKVPACQPVAQKHLNTQRYSKILSNKIMANQLFTMSPDKP